ncbi:MAG TPA: phosphatase, partial [Planctomycetaceae bacterium]|nr:phosphatase [Planctomycetaceae bacterium]
MKRRDFFQLSAAAVGSFAISDSLALMHKLKAQEKADSVESLLGPIKPVKDQATGLELLLLPDGFSYTSFGWSKDMMDDGVKTPGA